MLARGPGRAAPRYQDRTLLAMQQLEAALGAAVPRREQVWRNQVRTALGVLGEAAKEEAENAAQPDSLLSDIARTQGLGIRHSGVMPVLVMTG
jgi:hypothetical protein